MKTSHPSISSTEIQDFGDDAFIRLDIGSYLELLGIDPIAPQIALINAINSPDFRFVTGVLSRRTGKTTIANIIAQLVLLVPGSNVLIISPNYSLSEISWSEQKRLLNHFDIEVVRNNAKDKVIELQNGSVLRIGSVSQADSVVGRSYDLILFDEAALDDKGRDAFNIQLRPTLDKPNSKGIFISTPRGKNYLHDFYFRGYDSEFPQWSSVFSTWTDNPRAVESDIEEARKSMSRAEFEQEYMCSFDILEGTIWNLPDGSVIDTSLDTSSLDIIAGIDIGYRDDTAMVVFATDFSTIYIIDEFVTNTSSTASIAASMQKLIDRWDIDFIYIDSAAAQMRHDLAELHDISTVNANKSVLEGINFVASVVESGRLKVMHTCTKTIEMFSNYSWDNREGLLRERPKHDKYSHLADAVRYSIYSYKSNLE